MTYLIFAVGYRLHLFMDSAHFRGTTGRMVSAIHRVVLFTAFCLLQTNNVDTPP